MKTYEFGNADSDIVLIQPVGDHDLEGIENEFKAIISSCGRNVHLIAVRIDGWNSDLSPWEAPAVFGKENFGSGASETLGELLKLCRDKSRSYYIGGYSLAGLFAIWAVYQTDVFRGAAAASPSMWFPGFAEYMKKNEIKTDTVYLSLGDREEKTRNPIMATVGDRIREAHVLLKERGVNCILEWNEGNHYRDADLRTAKAFGWVLNNKSDADFHER
ncbi:MAG: esterase [Parasporobacterium sp.]|nr:esterase [Parasporobacterium sp.]